MGSLPERRRNNNCGQDNKGPKHEGRVARILYCNETQALTTPFIVYSSPDADRIVDNVWPERWVLPFKIHPLGSPDHQLGKEEAKSVLPIFKRSTETNFGKIFHVQAVTVFSPTKIELADWEVLIERLVTH